MYRTLFFLSLECLPLIVLFVAGHLTDFFTAIWWYLGSILFSISVIGAYEKRFPYLSVIFGSIIIISGTVSNILKEPDILILADSLYYLGAASVLAVLRLRGVNGMEKLFYHTFAIERRGWDILLWRWVVVLALAGICNEIVRLTQSPEFWIHFQFYRSIVILIFATSQFGLTRRYRLESGASSWGLRL